MTSLTTLLAIMKYKSTPNNAALIDIDIVDIFRQKYQYRIDVGTGDIDPSLN